MTEQNKGPVDKNYNTIGQKYIFLYKQGRCKYILVSILHICNGNRPSTEFSSFALPYFGWLNIFGPTFIL